MSSGFAKGYTPWNKGLTKETDARVKKIAENISKSLKGIDHSNEIYRKKISETLKGHEVSDVTRAKISESMIAFASTDYGKKRHHEMRLKQWSNEGFREQRSNRVTADWENVEFRDKQKDARNINPNKLEQDFARTFPKLEFVGDFSFIVGSKNPDFILPDTNFCVDLFGDYWHELEEEQKRIRYFKKKGYDLTIIWEHEWTNNKDEIIEKINNAIEKNA